MNYTDLIKKSPAKSGSLDPIIAHILKKHAPSLVPCLSVIPDLTFLKKDLKTRLHLQAFPGFM